MHSELAWRAGAARSERRGRALAGRVYRFIAFFVAATGALAGCGAGAAPAGGDDGLGRDAAPNPDAGGGDGDGDADADSDGDADGDGDCTRGRFEGDYTISDPATLEALRGYTSVGSLAITEADVVTLDGLECLREVDGELAIFSNGALTNVDGLAALTSTRGLYVGENPALASLEGLAGVTSVAGALLIERNAALPNVDGLRGLTGAVTFLSISGNGALTNLDGLAGLTRVDGCVIIGGNTVLANLDGLDRLASSGEDLGAAGLSCPITFTLSGNPALTSLRGLSGLTSFFGVLSIHSNDALTNLDGLGGLTLLQGLSIGSNAALSSLDGLSGLTAITGWVQPERGQLYLSIERNGALTNLDGLGELTELAGDFRVRDNSALPTCEATALEAHLVSLGWDGQSEIAGNDDAGVCN